MILKMLINYARLCWGLQTITTTEVESEMIYGFWMFIGLILDIIIAIALVSVFIMFVIPWLKETIEEWQLKRDEIIHDLNKKIHNLNETIAKKDMKIQELNREIISSLGQHKS